MAQESLKQAQALMDELIQAAQRGAIIPVRLAGQLEAIQTLLMQAADESSRPAPVEQEAFLQDQAQFISHAVHELRTPMTSIRGYSDMLGGGSMGALNDMQKQFVETVRSNARRMESLLQDVSDINKLRASTLRTNMKIDMFKNIAMMVEKQMKPLAEQLGRNLVFEIPQGLPILNTDGELLAKALNKLVENGLRYSPEGSTVTLRAAAEHGRLVIQVQDQGIGMSPGELNRLGEVYFRADNDVVRSYKGSGLGITIAYGLIHLLGGTIDVVSTPNQGTTFTITLEGMS